ncbi:MAG: primase C-terminal domain-containing protein [Enterococcus sp.]|nr:primase C-terminal domain-containing protein [Enterococcus sp.]
MQAVKIRQEKKVAYNYVDFLMETYDHVMFPKRNAAGFVAVAEFEKNLFKQNMFPVEEWTAHIGPKDCYLSVNTFYRRKRDTRSARHLNAFYVDIDFYNMAVSLDDVIETIHHHVRYERIPEPTFIISSGRGIYVIWKIEDVPGRYESAKRLYGHIQDYLIKLFEDVGADSQARDIARVLRVPGTINSKNGQVVQFLEANTKNVYTMRMFQEYVDPFEEYRNYQSKKTVKKESKRGQVRRLLNIYTLNKARCADFERLCALRGYKMTGYRNMLLHAYAWALMNIHQDEKVALYYVQALNDDLSEPLHDGEIKSIVRSVAKAYADHLKDSKKGYRYKTETLIKRLDISLEEQKQLKTIISTQVKYDRNNERRTPRNEEGLTKRQADKQYLVKQVQQLKERGYKQREIAEMMEISERHVKRIYKEIREKL